MLILTFIFVLSFQQTAWADIESDLMDSDTITSDSEAALAAADELQEELAEEKKEETRLRRELKLKQAEAKIKKQKADREIVLNEKKINKTRQKIATFKNELKMLSKKQKVEEERLRSSRAHLANVEEAESLLKKEKQKNEKLLVETKKKNQRIKNRAQGVAHKVNKLISNDRTVRANIAEIYQDMNKSRNEYRNLIKKRRINLAVAEKGLDRLETAIQVDQEYDKKLIRLGQKPEALRTISGTNRRRTAKLKSLACNIREFPSAKGRIVGKRTRSDELQISYHNSKWYTTIYDGEKAFVSRKCFN